MSKAGKWFKKVLGLKKSSRQPDGSGSVSTTVTSPDMATSSEKPSKSKGLRLSFGGKKINKEAFPGSGAPKASGSAEQGRSSIGRHSVTGAYGSAPRLSQVNPEKSNPKDDLAIEAARPEPISAANSWTHDDLAAITIQKAYRRHLAKKAARALRALIKVQAVARGYMVRKQMSETYRCFQSLVKVQSRSRSQRKERFEANSKQNQKSKLNGTIEPSMNGWTKSMEIDSKSKSKHSSMASGESTVINHSTSSTADSYSYQPLIKSRQQHYAPRITLPNKKGSELIASTEEFSSRYGSADDAYSLFSSTSKLKRGSRRSYTMSESGDSVSESSTVAVPNYMLNTQSSKAKRCTSAPRERVGTGSTNTRNSTIFTQDFVRTLRSSYNGAYLLRGGFDGNVESFDTASMKSLRF